mmetsp:Transcript_106305/g.300773  ORF Transcript_106305/g.300773 Transcript_106305/m.300773 type:complete len:139 (+) Transcript_106305:1220-1636(+)
MSALGEDFATTQLRLERCWAETLPDTAERSRAVANIDAARGCVTGLRAGSIAPRPLVDGRWVMDRSGCHGEAVGRILDWLYHEQVARDLCDVQGIDAVFAQLKLKVSGPPVVIPQYAWPSALSRMNVPCRPRNSTLKA